MSSITVFSGLSIDNTEKGFNDCEEIGKIIAKNKFTMICAGASLGCQKNLIQGALSENGEVIAVTVPKFEHQLQEELKKNAIVAQGKDLSERKSIMKSKASYGYIILPGGPGTLDELWEIISEKHENINDGGKKKIIIVNTDGFYDPVKIQFKNMNDTFKWKYDDGITFINKPAELIPLLQSQSADGGGAEKHGRRHMRKTKKDKTSKRKTSKRKTSKRKTSKRKTK
jgi:uncharacterized protein (TIGR00730 family)